MQLFKVVLSGFVSARISTVIMGVAGLSVYFIILILTKVIDLKNISKMIFKKMQKQQVS